MLYWDMPYGYNIGDWDKAPTSVDDLKKVVDAYVYCNNNENTMIALWVNISLITMYWDFLKKNGWKGIMPFAWVKPDQHQMTAHYNLQCMEVMLLAWRQSSVAPYEKRLKFQRDHRERRNYFEHPYTNQLTKRGGQFVNKAEKPFRLTEKFFARYTSPKDYVVIIGTGAGGDVEGALRAGLNIVGVEKDVTQYQASVARVLQSLDRLSSQKSVYFSEIIKDDIKNKRVIPDADKYLWDQTPAGSAFPHPETAEPLESVGKRGGPADNYCEVCKEKIPYTHEIRCGSCGVYLHHSPYPLPIQCGFKCQECQYLQQQTCSEACHVKISEILKHQKEGWNVPSEWEMVLPDEPPAE